MVTYKLKNQPAQRSLLIEPFNNLYIVYIICFGRSVTSYLYYGTTAGQRLAQMLKDQATGERPLCRSLCDEAKDEQS